MRVINELIAMSILTMIMGNNLSRAMDLVFATLVWRHGDRSYMKTYPNDPYKNKGIWKNGFGQLTNIGIKQQYELGRFLRSRYDKILSEEYLRDEIYIRSTDKDRTLMSAESNLAGLYPPTKEERWNGTHTAWHPIPVHTVALSSDRLLRYPIEDCPNYDKLRQKIRQSSWYTKHEKKNSQFYDFITEKTGSAVRLNLSNSWEISDNLFCLSSHNYTLPAWATREVFSKLVKLNALDMGLLFTDVDFQYRETIAQMQGGVLLKEILQNMTDHINGNLNRSMIAYSAHDTTLSALLVAVGNYDWLQPPYASCLMFELYRDVSGEHYVKLYYRNSTESAPILLRFYECDALCPFQTFQSISSRLIPVNRAEVCGSDIDNAGALQFWWLVVLIPAAILVLILMCLLLVNRKKKGPEYQKIAIDEFESPI